MRIAPALVALLLVASAVLVAAPAAAHCFDGQRDGTETAADCGGACTPCAVGGACSTWRDCVSGKCADGICVERPHTGGPVPSGYDVVASDDDAAATARKTGTLLFVVGYAAAYAAALAVPTDNAVLFVPVYGPWAMSARSGQENPGLLVGDAVVQTVGAVLLFGGIIGAGGQLIRSTPQPSQEGRQSGRADQGADEGEPEVSIMAGAAPTHWTVGLVGRF